ncbi:MAG: Hsp20/alpha crystallin family protein [Bdellovibrionota bacterium]
MGEQQNPFRAMARMQRDMDRMFEDFWSGNLAKGMSEFSQAAFRPLYNVEEKGSHFLLTMDVPGFSKDDIKVEVLDNQLHIYGEKKTEHEEKKGKRFESSYGSIEQWLSLPQNTKPETVEAQIENGVLRVAIPRTEASMAKQIKIGEGKTGIFSKLLESKGKAA